MCVTMGFGNRVAALLEIYSNCIALLKTSKDRRPGSTGSPSHDQQSLLRRSLRSDRMQVRRAYSSGVSELGDRFEKGDGKPSPPTSKAFGREFVLLYPWD